MATPVKRAVITGASQGIGAATATEMIAAGYEVFNFSRSASKVAGVANIQVDLAAAFDTGKLEALLQPLIGKPAVTTLVHNAYRHEHDSVATLADQSFTDVLRLNLQAPNALNRLLIPTMQSGSSIIYVGSTLSEKAVAGAFSYTLTKHAVVGMMRATTQDLAGQNIHSVCICPGFTDTKMLRQHIGTDPEVLAAVQAKSSENRLIEPKEIACTIRFAAETSTLNGSVIHAHLGQIET